LAVGSSPSPPLHAQTDESTEQLQPNQNSSAVEDISGKSYWLDDLLSKGSPLHLGLTTGEIYDDNIFISPQKTADFLTQISPSIDFEKGDRTAAHANYLTINFVPTIFLYANNPHQDREDYDADIFYQYQWTRLTLGLEQHYQKLTDATIDVGNLVRRSIYTTVLSGNYDYNGNLSFSGTATQRITSYPSGSNVDTNEWIIDGYANYQVAPKLQLGLGPRLAFVDISGAPNEDHQDLLLHLNYNPGGKITVTFAGGLEYLQFQGNEPSHVLPIFDFTANYTPREGTNLSLSGYRESINSYDTTGQVYLSTLVQLSFRQRILQDVYFTASGGYNISDYEFGSSQLAGPKRRDNYFFANVGGEWDPKDWLKVSASYQRSENDSNFEQNSFNDNKIYLQTSLQF
jgi:hypothetical protein